MCSHLFGWCVSFKKKVYIWHWVANCRTQELTGHSWAFLNQYIVGKADSQTYLYHTYKWSVTFNSQPLTNFYKNSCTLFTRIGLQNVTSESLLWVFVTLMLVTCLSQMPSRALPVTSCTTCSMPRTPRRCAWSPSYRTSSSWSPPWRCRAIRNFRWVMASLCMLVSGGVFVLPWLLCATTCHIACLRWSWTCQNTACGNSAPTY